MKKIEFLVLALLAFAACNSPKNKEVKTGEENQPEIVAERDTTPRVTGIGGIFFGSEKPSDLREWYGKNLGLEITEYGSTFEFRNGTRPDEINYLQWSPFKKGNEYFKPSTGDFMINYRVQNIEGLVRNLKASGVKVTDTIETYDYGKFVHILDMEGNKIELWEPVDSVLTKLGGKTNK